MASDDLVWRVSDPLGRRVSLSRDCWYDHILLKRPELEPHALRLAKVVSDPVVISRDVDFVSTRQNFYRRGVYRGQPRKFIKVTVEFEGRERAGIMEGSVVTIQLVSSVPDQEVRTWPQRW